MLPKLFPLLLLAVALIVTSACRAPWPADGPQANCVQACARMQIPSCNEVACTRGCNLVSDRVVERQDAPVLACVQLLANKHARCDERVWATCAPRVGPYLDGGPPAPIPPPDTFEDEE